MVRLNKHRLGNPGHRQGMLVVHGAGVLVVSFEVCLEVVNNPPCGTVDQSGLHLICDARWIGEALIPNNR